MTYFISTVLHFTMYDQWVRTDSKLLIDYNPRCESEYSPDEGAPAIAIAPGELNVQFDDPTLRILVNQYCSCPCISQVNQTERQKTGTAQLISKNISYAYLVRLLDSKHTRVNKYGVMHCNLINCKRFYCRWKRNNIFIDLWTLWVHPDSYSYITWNPTSMVMPIFIS